MRSWSRYGFCCMLAVLCSCSTTFSKFDAEIDPHIRLPEVLKNPDIFQGKTTQWGGRIIKASNRHEGTLFEILQLPLDRSGRPKAVDSSEGRFLALHPDFLDGMIYREGRDITVVGRVDGVRQYPLGEITYSYPLIKVDQVHLWEEREKPIRVYHEFPPDHYRHRLYWWAW